MGKGHVGVGLLGLFVSAQSAFAGPTQDDLALAFAICAPFVAEGAGVPPQAGVVAQGELRDAFMGHNGYDPQDALRQVEGLPFVVITQGVKGCWVTGKHDSYDEVLASANAFGSRTAGASIERQIDFGVSADGSYASVGLGLSVAQGPSGPLDVTVLTFGPAVGGYYEVNVQLADN